MHGVFMVFFTVSGTSWSLHLTAYNRDCLREAQSSTESCTSLVNLTLRAYWIQQPHIRGFDPCMGHAQSSNILGGTLELHNVPMQTNKILRNKSFPICKSDIADKSIIYSPGARKRNPMARAFFFYVQEFRWGLSLKCEAPRPMMTPPGAFQGLDSTVSSIANCKAAECRTNSNISYEANRVVPSSSSRRSPGWPYMLASFSCKPTNVQSKDLRSLDCTLLRIPLCTLLCFGFDFPIPEISTVACRTAAVELGYLGIVSEDSSVSTKKSTGTKWIFLDSILFQSLPLVFQCMDAMCSRLHSSFLMR